MGHFENCPPRTRANESRTAQANSRHQGEKGYKQCLRIVLWDILPHTENARHAHTQMEAAGRRRKHDTKGRKTLDRGSLAQLHGTLCFTWKMCDTHTYKRKL